MRYALTTYPQLRYSDELNSESITRCDKAKKPKQKNKNRNKNNNRKPGKPQDGQQNTAEETKPAKDNNQKEQA